MSNHGTEEQRIIRRFIAATRTRMQAASICKRLCRAVSVGCGLALLALLVASALGFTRGRWSFFCAGIPVASGLITLLLSMRKQPGGYAVAVQADRALDLKDQLASAYDFVESNAEQPIAQLTISQVAETLTRPGMLSRAAPVRTPASLWIALALAGSGFAAYGGLFPVPPERRISDATYHQLAEGRKSLEGLLALEADLTDGIDKQEFQRFRKLISDLNMMSKDATKEEILARLSREIAGIDAQDDSGDPMAQVLDELKKLKDHVAGGDLMEQLQKELDQQAQELSVVDDGGEKKSAEAIQTMALVEKEAMAKKHASNEALAKELKQVARDQTDAEGATKEWELQGETAEQQVGSKKKLKKGPLTYEALGDAVENRDIRGLILAAAADTDRSSAAYSEVLSNYERILGSVLVQKRVPVGQQMYIKRYFKAIRARQASSEN